MTLHQVYVDYRLDLATLSDADLWAFKYRNQQAGRTMGEIATGRGNVKRANAALRLRGLLKDAKGQQLTKDATGLVAAAVAPLKAAAQDYAAEQAREYIAKLVAQFEGKDLNEVAPRPKSTMSRIEYKRAQSRRNAIAQVLKTKPSGGYSMGAPQILVRDEAREIAFVAGERSEAGVSFDAYVIKLESKVGQGVTAASVDSKRLWTGSVLTVSKGAVIERWHTQQIINYSVLGNAYNQWPTRLLKMKEAA